MAFGRLEFRVLSLLLLLTLVSIPLSAQTVTGTMSGTVTDRTGGALPGVTVTIRNAETGLERVVVTNEAGFFNAPFLPVGRYNVNAELAGLGTARRQNVPVNLNETTKQDFVVDPQMAESITVNAEAPRINVSDGEIKQTMRSEEIMALPSTDQGSFLRLASAFSGYQENMSSGQDNPTLSSGSSVNFNGAGTRGTTFQINGVNNDDSSENQNRQGVALATIKSFQVLSNSFSSEFGRGYGAVVLVQTKSGTNELGGEIYGYARDNKYNAKRKLEEALPKPENHRYEYGLTAGFPLMRDRLFGFLSASKLENEGNLFNTRGVFLQSDLTSLPRLTLGNDTPENRAWQDSIIARFPNAAPNNPSVGSRAYRELVFNDFPDDDYSGRLDWNATVNNNVTARYQKSHQLRNPGELIVGETARQDNRQSNFGLTWTNILSSNTVQEARYGLGNRSTNVNISSGNDTPIVRLNGLGFTFTILGNAGAFPIIRDQVDQQLVYNISTARWAQHTLKVGTDIRRSDLDDLADNFSRGFWTFNAACGGVTYPSSVHAFMAGCVSSYQKGYGPFDLKNDLAEENFYAQDDWRPWDNLTLNLGVRYERVAAPVEEDNKIDYFYKDSDYIDPRLGFAYTPNWGGNRFTRFLTGENGKFSIRGGYGHYHGRIFQSIFSQSGANVRFNPPTAASRTFSNSTHIADPSDGFVFVPGTIAPRATLTLIDPDLQMPETRQWNLTFERQVFSAAKFRASYIGTLGKNLLQYRIDNKPVVPAAPGTVGAAWVVAQDWRCAGTGLAGAPINATCPVAVPLAANEVSLRFPKNNERRPDARYGQNLTIANLAESNYHAGQLEFETGLWHGLSGRTTYTYSKAIDTGSEATSTGTGDINIFPEDEDYKRGLSRFDTRHRFTLSGSYLVPFFQERKDWVGSLLGGWQVSTLIRLSSGTPFTIVDTGAQDIDFDGVSNQRPICVRENHCGGYYVNHPSNSQAELPRDAFRRAEYGDTTDDFIGRNTFTTDGLETVDLGLYKSFRLPIGSDSVMLRLDVFNIFNHTTWSWPVNDIASANFGRITTVSDSYSPRTFQLGLRYIY